MKWLNWPTTFRRARTSAMVAMIAGSLLAAKDQPAFAVHSPLADEALFVRLDANADGRLTVGEIPPEHRRLFGRLLRRADANRDEALDQAEFLAGLVPTRPEKELEEKQSAEFPGADAIRWLLLSMDTNGNGSITAEEVPENLKSVLESMPPQIDRNENGVLERNELNQGGRFLSNMATRTAQQLRIDVAAELAKLERSQGAAFNRFDDQGGRRGRGPQLDLPLGNPQQARRLFQQFDANGDGQAEPDEVPAEARPAFQRLLQAADRDGDGRLSQREFVVGVEQLSGQRGGVRAGPRGARGRARRGGPIPALDGLPVPDAGGMDGGQGMNAAPGDATPDGSGMPGRGR